MEKKHESKPEMYVFDAELAKADYTGIHSICPKCGKDWEQFSDGPGGYNLVCEGEIATSTFIRGVDKESSDNNYDNHIEFNEIITWNCTCGVTLKVLCMLDTPKVSVGYVCEVSNIEAVEN